jgi:hypothetical protein
MAPQRAELVASATVGQATSRVAIRFHAIATLGVPRCPNASGSVLSADTSSTLARIQYAPKAAGFLLESASFVLAPPTRVERVTFGLGKCRQLLSARTGCDGLVAIDLATIADAFHDDLSVRQFEHNAIVTVPKPPLSTSSCEMPNVAFTRGTERFHLGDDASAHVIREFG